MVACLLRNQAVAEGSAEAEGAIARAAHKRQRLKVFFMVVILYRGLFAVYKT
jgi:hypothetical protein